MIPVAAGASCFILFFLYDVFTLRGTKGRTVPFALGCIGLASATAWLLWVEGVAARVGETPAITWVCLTGAALMLAGLIYTLFFALPFSNTYVADGEHKTVDTGLYGACRHPGVWFLSGMYLMLALAVPTRVMWAAFALYTTLDILYVWLQDKFIFPKTLGGWERYRSTTPFLIPNKGSLARMVGRK